jgi:hypothetical protein
MTWKLSDDIQTLRPVSYTAGQTTSFNGWSTNAVTALRTLSSSESSAATVAQVLATLINDLMNPNKTV